MLSPQIVISPESGVSKSAMVRNRVDFPHPDGPIRAVREPCGQNKSTFFSACSGSIRDWAVTENVLLTFVTTRPAFAGLAWDPTTLLILANMFMVD
jgi:hypothetical protein